MDYDDLLGLTPDQIGRISDRAWQDILSRTHAPPSPRTIIRVQDRKPRSGKLSGRLLIEGEIIGETPPTGSLTVMLVIASHLAAIVQRKAKPVKPVAKRRAEVKANWDEIVAMRRSGIKVADIERMTGVSDTQIYRILARRKPQDL